MQTSYYIFFYPKCIRHLFNSILTKELDKMKSVLDLTKAITDGQFYKEQFDEFGTEKNILFLEPQLTSRHLYKFILPYFCFYNEKVYTAITGLDKYDPYRQIVGIETRISQPEILWANYIVIPFTTMDLSVKVSSLPRRPRMESYLSRWASVLLSVRSLMPTISMSAPVAAIARK